MNYFDEKQLNELRPYEHHFYTATKENYKRATPSTLNDKIADLYQEVTGNKLNRNWTCGTCVLNAFKAVGELYYQSLENLKVQKNLEQSSKHSEAQDTLRNTQGAEDNGANDTKSKGLEPEPAPIDAESQKTVANKGGRPKGSKNKKK